jgi:hypothetical protein
MAKKISGAKTSAAPRPQERERVAQPGEGCGARPSSLLDTRVVYCGDNLEQLAKLPDACVDLIYIDLPAWPKPFRRGEGPRCVQLARVLKKTGSFYYHCDWHASHYVKVMLNQIFGENSSLRKRNKLNAGHRSLKPTNLFLCSFWGGIFG